MEHQRTVSIYLGTRSYDIHIGNGVLSVICDFLPFKAGGKSFYVITDENVLPIAKGVVDALNDGGAGHVYLNKLPTGESTKSYASLTALTEWMIANGITRDSCVVAVGGGVIGDLAGFAASVVMRGVDFIQMPTSLLAQVDSSVGGKTGINSPQGKNLIGAFYQPRAVIIDLDTLKTLPKRQVLAGYAEIAKYGLINDADFFAWLEQNGQGVCDLEQEALLHAIETSVKAKAEVVAADEREGGVRALLNLGHTFGHALEAAADYDGRLLHGEAVSIGMVMAFDLSLRLGEASQSDLARVQNHLQAIGLPTGASQIAPKLDVDAAELYTLMKRDKKVKDGRINMILVHGIGNAYITADVPESLIMDVIEDSLKD